MYPFDNTIGLKHEEPSAIRSFHDGAVIPRAYCDCSSGQEVWQQLAEQTVFAQFPEFHGEKISGNASAVSVSELKSECIVIATRIEPLHS